MTGGGKWLRVFTAILKTLTAEMYPSIPQHDLMIRAQFRGKQLFFSPPNPKSRFDLSLISSPSKNGPNPPRHRSLSLTSLFFLPPPPLLCE